MKAGPTGVLAITALLLAVVSTGLSFTRLGAKVYWHDEAYTSLRVFGHSGPDYYASLFDGNIHTTAELKYFQHADPALGIDATLKALASRPEHPPLYFLLARVWSGLFADPVVALRSLSAVFGLLLLPAVFWFARESFCDPRVSWTAVALAAVSPLHLLYAQEARQYSLWCMLVMLSGAALLHALRTGRPRDYILYAVTVALGMYAHIMFAIALVAHAIYLALMRKTYPRSTIRGCAVALISGALLFLPWLVLFVGAIQDVSQVTGWMKNPVATDTLMLSWLTSVNRLFFDFPGSGYLIPVSSGLAMSAVFLLLRRTPSRVWLLPVLLVVVTGGAVIGPDLLDGGRRSLETRYLLPLLLSLQLCVAWLIGTGSSMQTRRGRVAGAAGLLVIAGGIASQLMIVSSNTWWNKSFSANNAEVAAVINAADRPLLISTLGAINPGELLSLSYFLRDRVRLLLLHDAVVPELPAGYDRYFVLNPPWGAPQAQERGYTLERVKELNMLWELHDCCDRKPVP